MLLMLDNSHGRTRVSRKIHESLDLCGFKALYGPVWSAQIHRNPVNLRVS